MAGEITIHSIQAQILRGLLFKPSARFAELNPGTLTNDHFTFHIKKLVEDGYLEKLANGHYRLSTKGKEFANRMDTENMTVEKQAKLAILIVCKRQNNGKNEFLLQTRLKHPFFGYRGFISGKMRWGETVLETASRELKEETGLAGKLKFVGIEHKIDYQKDGNLLEDKYFYIVLATNLEGELMTTFEGGENNWVEEEKIASLDKLFADVGDILDIAMRKGLGFTEKKYIEEEY